MGAARLEAAFAGKPAPTRSPVYRWNMENTKPTITGVPMDHGKRQTHDHRCTDGSWKTPNPRSPVYRWIMENTKPTITGVPMDHGKRQTHDHRCTDGLRKTPNPVGAGLPAKASSWAVQGSRPPSLASQLLHDNRCTDGIWKTPNPRSPVYRWIVENAKPCHRCTDGLWSTPIPVTGGQMDCEKRRTL
ncbi:hypothetical protein PS914_04143 [Pseudomonas fluorescens]|nr:hypothetical protein PS914_04143 [Pseudomonas fluorescens]